VGVEDLWSKVTHDLTSQINIYVPELVLCTSLVPPAPKQTAKEYFTFNIQQTPRSHMIAIQTIITGTAVVTSAQVAAEAPVHS
jgi:hypothetical protein